MIAFIDVFLSLTALYIVALMGVFLKFFKFVSIKDYVLLSEISFLWYGVSCFMGMVSFTICFVFQFDGGVEVGLLVFMLASLARIGLNLFKIQTTWEGYNLTEMLESVLTGLIFGIIAVLSMVPFRNS